MSDVQIWYSSNKHNKDRKVTFWGGIYFRRKPCQQERGPYRLSCCFFFLSIKKDVTDAHNPLSWLDEWMSEWMSSHTEILVSLLYLLVQVMSCSQTFSFDHQRFHICSRGVSASLHAKLISVNQTIGFHFLSCTVYDQPPDRVSRLALYPVVSATDSVVNIWDHNQYPT